MCKTLKKLSDKGLRPVCEQDVAFLIRTLTPDKLTNSSLTDSLIPLVPLLCRLLHSPDTVTAGEALGSLEKLSRCPKAFATLRGCPGAIPDLMLILRSSEVSLHREAIICVGNLANIDDEMCKALVNSGAVEVLHKVLLKFNTTNLKNACWALSNLVISAPAAIGLMLESGVYKQLVTVCSGDIPEVNKEVVWVIFNSFFSANEEQFQKLLDRELVEPLLRLAQRQDNVELQFGILCGLSDLLAKLGSSHSAANLLRVLAKHSAPDVFEALQYSSNNNEIRKEAGKLLGRLAAANHEGEYSAPQEFVADFPR